MNPIELQKHLGGVDYPAGKQELIDQAGRNGAGEDVRALLGRLPERDYRDPTEVSEAVAALGEEGSGAHIDPIGLQGHLGGVDYPASRQELIDQAGRNGAGEDVQALLGRLPEREYHGPTEVSEAVGGLNRSAERGE